MDCFYIKSRGGECVDVVFEPVGIDFSIGPGSTMKVEFWGGRSFVDAISFKDGFVEIHSMCSFKIYIDDEEIYEFDFEEVLSSR